MTYLAKIAFLWRRHTFIVAIWRRLWWWVVVTVSGISRGGAHRKWWGPTWCPIPVQAVAFTIQALPAACPLLLAQLLPLHGFSQETVVVSLPAGPATVSMPVVPLQLNQIVTTAAASPHQVAGAPMVSSPPTVRRVVTTPAVIVVSIVATASAAAPLVVRAKSRTFQVYLKQSTRPKFIVLLVVVQSWPLESKTALCAS